MKKIFGYFLFILLIDALLLIVGFKFFAGPKIKELIAEKSQIFLGAPLVAETVEMKFSPLGIVIHNIRGQAPQRWKFAAQKIELSASLMEILSKKLNLTLVVHQPQGVFDAQAFVSAEAKASSAPSGSIPVFALALPWFSTASANIQIDNGFFETTYSGEKYRLSSLQLAFQIPEILDRPDRPPWKLTLGTALGINILGQPFHLPIKVQSEFLLEGDKASSRQTQLYFGGLGLTAKGTSELGIGMHKWDLELIVPDLQKIPQSQWAGQVSAHAQLEKLGANANWSGSGDLVAKNVKGQTTYASQDLTAQGTVAGEADTQFEFNGSQYKIQKIISKLNLSDLKIKYKDLFDKPIGVPLSMDLVGTQDRTTLRISKAALVFSKATADLSGLLSMGSGGTSDLAIQLFRTELSGFEKFFPPLAQSPMGGWVALKAHILGDWQKTESLAVDVSQFKMEKVQSRIVWNSEDKKKSVSGLFKINASGLLKLKGQNLISAQFESDADLTEMAIRIQDQFEKSAKESLRAVVVARQSGQSIGFSKSYLQSPFGKLDFSGQIKGFQNPSLDLNLNIAKLDLMALSRHVPLLKPWHLAGYASGGINIKGTYESNKGIESSPLSVQGQVQAQIPKLVFAPPSSPSTKISSSNATPSLDPNSASAPPTSYLPQWQVIKSLRLKTKLNVGSLQYHDLKLEDLAWDGGILTGQLQGRAKIGKIFSGQVICDDIKTSLITSLPTLNINAKFNQIDLGEALAWSMPEWKKLADGKASGTIALLLPAKERKDFIQAAQARGEIKIQNGYLSTLPFDKMINAKLASLPQIGLAKTPVVKTEGVRAQLDAAFEFQNGKLNLSRFHALTPDKNELTASGWILASDKSMDLKGQGFIANPPIQGDVLAANSDSQGRLVLPIHFTGTADNPSYNLADDTAKQLLTKTASYTAQKVKKQVQEGAVKEVKKQIQNQLKNILGQ